MYLLYLTNLKTDGIQLHEWDSANSVARYLHALISVSKANIYSTRSAEL